MSNNITLRKAVIDAFFHHGHRTSKKGVATIYVSNNFYNELLNEMGRDGLSMPIDEKPTNTPAQFMGCDLFVVNGGIHAPFKVFVEGIIT